MKNFLTSLAVSIIVSIGVVTLLQGGGVGATITTMLATDKLSDSRAVINTNLTNLNTDLTAIEATTTMSLLTGFGTITTGVWQATDVTVPNGGTGAGTFTQYQLLFGSSTDPIVSLGSIGTSGQFLTSGGASVLPTWTTSSINLTVDRTWTGYNTFTGGLFANEASSTSATTTDLHVTGVATFDISHAVATSTVFTKTGTWVRPTGVNTVTVQVVGGGGGGGGADTSSAQSSAGGGGGAACSTSIVDVTGNVTVTVGTGGAGGSNTGGNGAVGGNSTFVASATITGTGGGGGFGQGSSGGFGAGGSGGATTTADIEIKGQNGGDGFDTAVIGGGAGGHSCLGFGPIQQVNVDLPGERGESYGVGGSGAADNDSTGQIGGTGGDGVVIVTWYEL